MTIIKRIGPYGQCILFGDSLTEMSAGQGEGFNFMPELQNWYMRKLDVINRGFSGYTTRNGLRFLPEFMPTPQEARVQLMIIFFGANDACVPGEAQHVPVDEYKENLRRIVQHDCVQAHRPAILLITPPPVDEHASAGPAPAYRSRIAENTQLYAHAVIEVAMDIGVPVLDLWSWMILQAGWKKGEPVPGSRNIPQNAYLRDHFRDGLHLNSQGYRVLFDQVVATIERNYPNRAGPALPAPFPPWRDVNPDPSTL